jgi:hypothetical protein
VKDWLLGTQAAPACEAGAFARDRLMTVDRSRPIARDLNRNVVPLVAHARPLSEECFGRSAISL